MAVDREYRIRIQTVGDPSGAQAAAGALDEATGATKKGTAANEKAGKSFVELAEHSKGFHKLLHAIMELSPAAGLGLIAAFNGPQAAILGLIMLVRALKSGEEEAAKAAVEFSKEAGKGWGDIKGIINGVVDAVMKSDQAHSDWAKHLGEDSKKITTALDAQIGKLQAEAAAVKEVINAIHAASLARLEADKEAGRITPEQYAAKKAKIESDKRMGESSVDATASKTELAMVQTARDKAAKEAEAAKKAEAAANAAAEDAKKKTNAGALKAKAEADKKEAEELKAKMLEAQAGRTEAQQPGGMASFYTGLLNLIGTVGSLGMNNQMGTARENSRLTAAQKAEDEATKKYRTREDLAGKESDKAARAEAEQTALDLKAARAKKEAEEKVAQANELKLKAAAMATSVGEVEKGRERAEPMKRLGEVLPTPFGRTADADMRWAAEIARKLGDTAQKYRKDHPEVSEGAARGAVGRERGEVTGDDQRRLIEIATRIAGRKVSLSEAVALLEPAARNIEEFSKDVLRLVTVMGNLAKNMGPVRGRMDVLEAQVRELQSHDATRTLPGR